MPRSYLFVAVTLAVVVLTASACFAASVVVNGQPLPASPPVVEVGGSLLLPVRSVFDALGATVEWNGATETVTANREGTVVVMTIGSRTAYVDGAARNLAVAPRLIGDYTYVPLRFPAEAFGADVSWNPANQTAYINLGPGGAPPPASSQEGAPVVFLPQAGAHVGTRTEVSLQATPGVLQVIYTLVKRVDNGEVIDNVPGIRHLPAEDGSYQGAIATPRISVGDRTVEIFYDIHFRNGPNDGDPETVVTVYPNS